MGSLRRRLWYWFWRRTLYVADQLAGRCGWAWTVRVRNFAWRRVCHKLCCDHVDYGEVCAGCPLRAIAHVPAAKAAEPGCARCHRHDLPAGGVPV